MKINLLLSILLISAQSLLGQVIKPSDLVRETKLNENIETFQLFSEIENETSEATRSFNEFAEFKIEQNQLQSVLRSESKFVEFEFPITNSKTIQVELVEVDIYQGNDHIITAPNEKIVPVNIGKHYRGIVKGNSNSVVAISVFNNQVNGLISEQGVPSLVLGKVDGSENHVIYSSKEISSEFDFQCSMKDDGLQYKAEEFSNTKLLTDDVTQRCVRLYIEADYNIYVAKGKSIENTTAYITSFMNQVITLYANEGIKTSLSPLKIWTEESPYKGLSTVRQFLSKFQNETTALDGDLGQFVSIQNLGGIAAGFNGLCNPEIANKLAFGAISPQYSTLPNFSWTVSVVVHEFGHLFGSRHTHACVWNGDGTAIDSCAGYVEGPCEKPGIPSQPGTIMSYCHLTDAGIDFNKGFGPQPGNVIRNRYNNASCITATCESTVGKDKTPPTKPENIRTTELTHKSAKVVWDASTDNVGVVNYEIFLNERSLGLINRTNVGFNLKAEKTYKVSVQALDAAGNKSEMSDVLEFTTPKEPEPECKGKDVIVKLTTDKYADETYWAIFDDQGNIKVEGKGLKGNETYEVKTCLPDGCYQFRITDSYGDGICCNYGEGSFELIVDGKSITKGDSFGDSFLKDFCIGDEELDTESPTVPQNLKVLEVTSSTVTLAWEKSTDNVAVDRYELLADGARLGTVPADTDQIRITKLNPDTEYKFYVKAIDTSNNASDLSKPVTAKTEPPKPPTCTDGKIMNITLFTDGYANETSWELVNSKGIVVQSGNGYENNTMYKLAYCLPDDCYKFIIKDAYNDGICCDHGRGLYLVKVAGRYVAFGSEFQSSKTHEFCTIEDDAPKEYCEVKAESSKYEWIDFVGIGDIENESGSDNGYGDYTNQIANLFVGQNSITLSAGFIPGQTYGEYWAAWIDYNIDGKFTEDEQILASYNKSAQKFTLNFSTPENIKLGKTRLRVAMSYRPIKDACSEIKYGEVEDYSINLKINPDTATEFTRQGNNAFEIYPNPTTNGTVTVQFEGLSNGVFTIVNTNGTTVKTGELKSENQAIDVSDLAKGLYILRIEHEGSVSNEQFIIQ